VCNAGDLATGRAAARITIITPTLDRANMIETAVESVARQNHPDIEHIIVDGGSTDDTLARLSHYPHLRVVSEPDRGLYDAYNKGIGLASGRVVGFLNDDDYYEEGVFSQVAEAFRSTLMPQVVCGWASGVRISTSGTYQYDEEVRESPSDRLTLETLNLDPSETMLNARFFDKRIFDEVGYFDTRYAVGGDWDFMIRVALHRPRVSYVPMVVYRYREHEQQLSFGHDPERTQEGLQERLTILERLWRSSSQRPPDRHALRQLHSSVTLTAIGSALAHRRPGRAGTYVLRGLRYDPSFVMRLGSRLIARLGRSRKEGPNISPSLTQLPRESPFAEGCGAAEYPSKETREGDEPAEG
jgi:glycosyltransferase involved in cell wall biosynthesis